MSCCVLKCQCFLFVCCHLINKLYCYLCGVSFTTKVFFCSIRVRDLVQQVSAHYLGVPEMPLKHQVCVTDPTLPFVLFRPLTVGRDPQVERKRSRQGGDGAVQQQVVLRTSVPGSQEDSCCSADPESTDRQTQPQLLLQSQAKSVRAKA